MLIAHISDCHITEPDTKAYGIVPSAENLSRCVLHINQLTPRPDFVIVTGDITFDGRLDEAKYASRLLEELHFPYYIIPGNHDDCSTLLSAFRSNRCPVKDLGHIDYVFEEENLRCIAMDSTIPNAAGGELLNSQISWLESQLTQEPLKDTVIFMHHPPAKFGVLETDKDGFLGAEKLGELVSKYNNIKAIFCGHIHLTAHLPWNNTVISTAPSMGLQLVLDLTLSRHSEFTNEAPGYLLHYLNSENNFISHSITVKDIDGPYRFKEYSIKNKTVQTMKSPT